MEGGIQTERHDPISQIVRAALALLVLALGCGLMFNVTIDKLTLPRQISTSTVSGQSVITMQQPLLTSDVFSLLAGLGVVGLGLFGAALIIAAGCYTWATRAERRPVVQYSGAQIDASVRHDPYRITAEISQKQAQAELSLQRARLLEDQRRQREEWDAGTSVTTAAPSTNGRGRFDAAEWGMGDTQ